MLRARLLGPFRAADALMRVHPFKTAVAVTTVKAGLADLIVQRCVEKRGEVDAGRMATFVTFGFAYQGCFQYFMFNVWIERLCPGVGWLPTLQKIVAANLLADPVFFFPVFYTLREALAAPAGQGLGQTVRAAFSKYRANCFEDWANTWSVWLPGHAVTYGLCPLHLRMPWVAGVGFGYLSLLSITRGAYESEIEAQARSQAAAAPAELADSEHADAPPCLPSPCEPLAPQTDEVRDRSSCALPALRGRRLASHATG
jgi:protein Mpv17